MRLLTLAAACAVFGLCTPAFAETAPTKASAEVKKYINVAVTLYENLEYEKALKQLKKAKSKSSTAADESAIALVEGIVLADMGKEKEASEAFKTGLSLDPDAKLPLEVSRKVDAVFKKAQDNVRKLLGPQLEKEREAEQQRVEAEKAKAAEEQRKKDEEAARIAAASKPAEPDKPPPAVVTRSKGPSVRTLGFIPLGVGVLSAGAATYFLLGASSRQSSLLNGTAAPGDAIAIRDSGKTMATLGYVFGGVAVAGLAAAGLMFGLGGESGPPPVTVFAGPGAVYVSAGGTF